MGSYPVSPDGNWVVAMGPGGKIYLYPISGGAPTPVPGIDATYFVTQFSADSRSLYVVRRLDLPANVYRVDVASGRKVLWRTLMPADPSGVLGAFVSDAGRRRLRVRLQTRHFGLVPRRRNTLRLAALLGNAKLIAVGN